MSKLKFKNSIICDYASVAQGKKHTLVNVYSGDIILSRIPSKIRLAFYSEFIFQEKGEIELTFEFFQGKKSFAKANAKLSGGAVGQVGVILVNSFEVEVKRDGFLKIVAWREGYEKTTLLNKKIYGRTNPGHPTASQPPSEQSPPDAPAS